jgi:hypothetical protein
MKWNQKIMKEETIILVAGIQQYIGSTRKY